MRVILILLFGMTAPHIAAVGGTTRNGVYLTKQDFELDILSYPSLQEGDTLEELRDGNLKLLRSGSEIIFIFGQFYGYLARGSKFFAFGTRGPFHFFGYFQILDQSGLTVYMKRMPNARFVYTEIPYFSVSAGSKKYPLNVRNLKKHVPLNRATLREVRWFQHHLPSLAYKIESRCAVNCILYPVKPRPLPEPVVM